LWPGCGEAFYLRRALILCLSLSFSRRANLALGRAFGFTGSVE
jgi:hypothetical protein